MEWLKTLLAAQGLTEEQITAVIGGVNAELPKQFIPKDKYNTLNAEKQKLEADVATRDAQLIELQGKVGTDETLKAEIEKLKQANKETQEKYEAELNTTKLNNEIDKALMAAGARNIKVARAALDLEKVKLIDGKLDNFSDQLKEVQEKESYLFGDVSAPSGTGGSKGNKNKNSNPNSITKEQFKAMGYAELIKLKTENAELYSELSKEE